MYVYILKCVAIYQYICIPIYLYIYTQINDDIYINTYIRIYMRIRLQKHTFARTYVYIYTYDYIHACIYICACACTHHIFTYVCVCVSHILRTRLSYMCIHMFLCVCSSGLPVVLTLQTVFYLFKNKCPRLFKHNLPFFPKIKCISFQPHMSIFSTTKSNFHKIKVPPDS